MINKKNRLLNIETLQRTIDLPTTLATAIVAIDFLPIRLSEALVADFFFHCEIQIFYTAQM